MEVKMNIRYPASESEKGQIIASIDVFLWYTERMADTGSDMGDSIDVTESVGDIDAALEDLRAVSRDILSAQKVLKTICLRKESAGEAK